MPAPKKATKKTAVKQAAASNKPAPPSLERRSARDPYTGPSSKRIEQSFKKGKTVTLEAFRGLIDWS